MFKNSNLKYKDKKLRMVFRDTLSDDLVEVKSFGQNRMDGWSNMLIYGDNLQALNFLARTPSIKGKVRMVYIDPPFATNQVFKSGKSRIATVSHSNGDEKAYEDKIIGGEYIEFLRKRLILLKNILAEDGSIYVHID